METFEFHYDVLQEALKKYMPGCNMELIQKAIDYANEKHKFQKNQKQKTRQTKYKKTKNINFTVSKNKKHTAFNHPPPISIHTRRAHRHHPQTVFVISS